MPDFSPTQKQNEAQILLTSLSTHIMLFGGSRSGKTFWLLRAIIARAMKAPGSRHAVLRQRFNHVIQSVGMDTLPKVVELCFPELTYNLDKQYWIVRLPNESEIWLGGLDDKERTEKILGQEHATIFLNECSQISWDSRSIAVTRLAQNINQVTQPIALPLRMYYDCNPPSKAHWSYKVFVEHKDPETRHDIQHQEDYACMQMNPLDNAANLPPNYISTLEALPSRMRRRFLDGAFSDATPNALFPEHVLDKWRHSGDMPEFQVIGIAVDPSGAGDDDNAENDMIGIMVGGLATDGNGYLLADLTVKMGPAGWGNVATQAYDDYSANFICAETNFGGAMVEHVIQTSRPNTPYRGVTASRGKKVRAEPVSALVEKGKVRLVGDYPDLEDELTGFSTTGYTGTKSPNRADAFVWLFTALFPGIVQETHNWKPIEYSNAGIV